MKCRNCGLENSMSFEVCYHCGAPRGAQAKPREVAVQVENSLLWALVLISVVVVMGFFGVQLMHVFGDILHQLP